MNNFPERTIAVTGGAKGIGRAICLAFASPGAYIYLNYRSSGKDAAETADLAREAGGRCQPVQGDVASEADMAALFKRIKSETGRIDVLVNNAGITKDSLLPRMKMADWEMVMDVNLKGAFICTKMASRPMIAQKSGRIINITSIAGVAGNSGQANYAAAKAGLIGLTKTTARELAPRGVTANAIAPGFIETDMTKDLTEEQKAEIFAQVPLACAGKPADVAGVAVFLASEAARYITGQVIHVNGGLYL